jgi:hypothetical protein
MVDVTVRIDPTHLVGVVDHAQLEAAVREIIERLMFVRLEPKPAPSAAPLGTERTMTAAEMDAPVVTPPAPAPEPKPENETAGDRQLLSRLVEPARDERHDKPKRAAAKAHQPHKRK